jgi:hypothetical protein
MACSVLNGRWPGMPTEDLSGPVSVKFRVLESRSGPRKDVLERDWAHGSVDDRCGCDPKVVNNRTRLQGQDDD